MHDQLHASAFIEKALGNHSVLTGDRPKHRAARNHIFNGLFSAGIVKPTLVFEPLNGVQHFRRFLVNKTGNGIGRQIADHLAQFAELV